MAFLNKVMLIGNLTRDPQLSYLPSQTPVVELGLAVNRNYTTKEGEKREETCFVDCRAFGRQAEVINKYLSKGRPVFIEGRLTYDTWTAQDGSKRSKHRVTIESFQFLGGGGSGRNDSQQGNAGYGGDQRTQQSESYPQDQDDDIPF